MSTTFTVPCKHCGNPIVIIVEDNHAGGVYGVCRKCSHGASVSYSFCQGKLDIYNVFYS